MCKEMEEEREGGSPGVPQAHTWDPSVRTNEYVEGLYTPTVHGSPGMVEYCNLGFSSF